MRKQPIRIEDIAPFRFPFGRKAAMRALELAKVPCNHALLLDRHIAASTQKRRDWPERMLGSDGWHGVEEYRQALNDAGRVPGDTRRRPWGPTEARNVLMHLTQAGLMVHDPDNERWREPTNPRHAQLNPDVSERHNARNRERYHADKRAHQQYLEELECLYGPFCAPTHPVSVDETPGLSPSNASESNSPAVLTTQLESNQSGMHTHQPVQPTASNADLDLPERTLVVAAPREEAASLGPSAKSVEVLRRALEVDYGKQGWTLRQFDAEDAEWVADWKQRHEGPSFEGIDVSGAMARMHVRWQAQAPKEPRPVKKVAKNAHNGPGLLKIGDRFNTPSSSRPAMPLMPSGPRAPVGPLYAQDADALWQERDAILARVQTAKPGRGPTRRLADIDEVLAALGDPPATLAQLHRFCTEHPWAGTLAPQSAKPVGGSIALWAYVARRMETKDEPATLNNPAGVLLWRVRQWRRAQVTDKGRRRRA